MRGQLQVTSQKLGLTQDELARARTLAQQIQKQQQDSDAQLGAQIGQVKQESEAKIGEVSTGLTGAKTDIAATQKDLADTKARLTTTVGDLGVQSGLIARNRDDLDALRRLNERNIFEFNLAKSKAPQHVGPIQVTLRSTDPKHFKYTMTVVADDKAVEKKDRTADEPVQFYMRGARAPYEIRRVRGDQGPHQRLSLDSERHGAGRYRPCRGAGESTVAARRVLYPAGACSTWTLMSKSAEAQRAVCSRHSPAARTMLALAGALPVFVPAAAAAPIPQISVQVNVVTVPVTVTNPRGDFVGNLEREDFRLWVDDGEQPIEYFAPEEEPAQVLILVETGPAVYLLRREHIAAAGALLAGLGAGDRVAVASYSEKPLAAPLDFTADKQRRPRFSGTD